MTAMDYSQVAHWYDIYVNTELDVPFFLDEAQGFEPVNLYGDYADSEFQQSSSLFLIGVLGKGQSR